jgi:hypothetical protein
VDQHIRTKVDFARPDDCAVIDANLGEHGRVRANGLEDGADEILLDVPLHNCSI